MMKRFFREIQRQEEGVTLIEVLVSLTLVAIAASGVYSGISTSLKVTKMTEVHYLASTIAISRIEELSSIDVTDLDNSYNETDTNVSWTGVNLTFLRDTTVVTNADDSRTITVNVTTDNDALPANVSFSTTFALWE